MMTEQTTTTGPKDLTLTRKRLMRAVQSITPEGISPHTMLAALMSDREAIQMVAAEACGRPN